MNTEPAGQLVDRLALPDVRGSDLLVQNHLWTSWACAPQSGDSNVSWWTPRTAPTWGQVRAAWPSSRRRATAVSLDDPTRSYNLGGGPGRDLGTPGLPSPQVTDEPLARLPDEVTLTRGEAAIVLFGLDVVDRAEVDAEEAIKVTRAVRLLTAKLWPDLGDLLGEDDQR